MFKNYVKIALRNLVKNKTYTIINVTGLALGVVCALVIYLIIRFEYSFDSYHDGASRIYRLVRAENQFGKTQYTSGVPYPLPDALRNDFPEIDHLTIVDSNFGSSDIAIEQKNGSVAKYREEKGIAFVHPDYFKIFSYEWLLGDPENALTQLNTAVISTPLAHKYFGDENPLGKTMTLNNRLNLQVTGVVEATPPNTVLPFNMLIAYDAKARGNDNWGSVAAGVQCYLKLSVNVPTQQIERRFTDFLLKYVKKEDATQITLGLQPLRDMHFDSRYWTFTDRTVTRESLLALALIGLFLLVAACINFVNLNTAVAARRAKEVGVRKVLGSSGRQLIVHFLGETALLTLLAILVSLTLAEIALTQLHSHLGYEIALNLSSETSIPIFLLILFGVITLGAGFYPALHLSKFNPGDAIRHKMDSAYGKGLSLRKSPVVLQFAISQVLLFCTLVVSDQMAFFHIADMGFNKEAIVEVELATRNQAKLLRFKNQLLHHAAIKHVSFSSTGTASSNKWSGNYVMKDGEQIKEGIAQVKFVDEDFITTYQLELVAGDSFGQSDTLKKFLVNQAFAKEVGYGGNVRELFGKYVEVWGREAPIAGIVKDFNTTSLHQKVAPVIMLMQNRYWQTGIKIDMRNAQGALAAIEAAWSMVYPEYTFSYAFLDETIANFYAEEQKTAQSINLFTFIAIMISCLGLFGLVSYMVTQRTKEIGIRKVLGASVTNVVALLSKDFVKLVLLANLIAWPVAWFAMHRWLESFAYRIEISWWVFALAGGLALLIALLTVSTQAVRAAVANPVESLRYE